MKITYFQNVTTIEELKKQYKGFAKKYHPDLNKKIDTNKIMSDINNEYEFLFKALKSGNAKSDKAHVENSNYRNIMDKIVIHDINIDIIGTWVWVFGSNTKAIKEELKGMGFRWSSGNKKWYWTETPPTKKKRSSMSYNQKIELYGIESVNKSTNKKDRVLLNA